MKFINLIALCFCLWSCSTTIPIEDFSIQKSGTDSRLFELNALGSTPIKSRQS